MLAYKVKGTIESRENYIYNLEAYKSVIGEYNNPQFSDFIDKTIESRISSRYDISFVYHYHKTKTNYYISKTKVLEETLFEDIQEKINSELKDYLLKEFADYKRELRKFKKKPIPKKAKYIKKLHSEYKNPDRKTKEYFLEFKNNIKKYRHYLIFDVAVSMMEDTNNVALKKDDNYAYLPLIYMMHLAFSSLIESRKAKELDINSIVDVELLCYATMMGTDYFVTSDKVLFKDGSWVLRNILDRKKPVILYFDKDNKKGYLEIIHFNDITLANNGVRVLNC